MLLGPIRSLIIALQGGDEPRHIAAGFALGAAWGLIPKGNLLGVLFLALFFLLRVDKGMAVLSMVVFTPVAYLLDGLAHGLGRSLLACGFLRPLWTALYDLPIVPLTRFNNTVVLGNLVLGALLYIPLYLAFLRFVHAYRARYKERVDRWPVVRFVKGLGWYQTYQRWTAP
jgi:uncharacterized protein (TIGR03546 family)